MASSVVNGEQLNSVNHIPLADQDLQSKTEVDDMSSGNHGGVCSICLDNIALQNVALVKGCEHTYCVTCILRWASYKEKPTCPQCKHPFEFLNIHRSLDGRIHDYMFEESVCLLLRATWFEPLVVDEWEMSYDDPNDYFPYEDEEDEEEDDLEYAYFNSSSSLRIGNRRWGDNGYVRAGRQEARPVHWPNTQHLGAGTSRQSRKKEVAKAATGRRAKRALKREAADKAAAEKHAAKHQEHLVRLGRNQEAQTTSD